MAAPNQREIPLALPEFLQRFGAFALVYFITGFVFLVWYRFQLNPDAVSYLEVAHGWATFDGRLIWNTYWSPLLPVLTAPLLLFGFPGIVAAKMVSLLGGLLALWVLWQLCAWADLSSLLRVAVMLGAGMLCIEAAMLQTTPDVLAAAAILLLMYLLVRPVHVQDQYAWIKIALALVLSYFAKLYLLYFAIVALPIVWLLRRRQLPGTTKTYYLRQSLLGYAVGLVGLCLMWVLPLSWHNGYFTAGDAGQFNYELVMARKGQFPMATEGIMPPKPGHRSAWTNITQHPYPAQWPKTTGGLIGQQIQVIADNLIVLAHIIGKQLYFLLLVPIGYMIWHHRMAVFRRPLGHLLLLFAVYTGGYLLVIVEQRYLLPGVLVALVMAAKGVQLYIQHELPHLPIVQLVPAALLVLAITERPAEQLLADRWTGKSYYELALQLDIMGEGLATTQFEKNDWHKGLYIAHWQERKYYGSLQPGTADRVGHLTLLDFNREPIPCPQTHTCQQLDSVRILQPKHP